MLSASSRHCLASLSHGSASNKNGILFASSSHSIAFWRQTHFVLSRCRLGGDLRRNLRFPQRRLNWRRSDCAAPPSRRCIELGIFRAKFRALNRCTHTTPSAPTKEAGPVSTPTRPLITRFSWSRGGPSCDDCVSSKSSCGFATKFRSAI
jgi:hypothetical protein